MKRRIVSLLLTISMAAALLTGCGSLGTEEDTTSAQGTAKGEGTEEAEATGEITEIKVALMSLSPEIGRAHV